MRFLLGLVVLLISHSAFADDTYFVTTSKYFHKPECPRLAEGIVDTTNLSGASGKGLRPCQQCFVSSGNARVQPEERTPYPGNPTNPFVSPYPRGQWTRVDGEIPFILDAYETRSTKDGTWIRIGVNDDEPKKSRKSTSGTTAGHTGSGGASGAIDVTTGQFFPSVGGGVINPGNGQFYPDVGGGYVNPQTGTFMPKIGP
jgi:hypothetical protein